MTLKKEEEEAREAAIWTKCDPIWERKTCKEAVGVEVHNKETLPPLHPPATDRRDRETFAGSCDLRTPDGHSRLGKRGEGRDGK